MDITHVKKKVDESEQIAVRKLEKWAEKIEKNTFFYYGEEKWRVTYREFNELANSIAHHLLSLGVQKGDRISLFLKNPYITTLMMFGIWKVGAVYAPINFNYMGRLLSYQINDTAPKLLITERQLVQTLNNIKGDIQRLNVILYSPKKGDHDFKSEFEHQTLDSSFRVTEFEQLLMGNRTNLAIELNPGDTANIIYTSGTTGPAKGVVQSHRWMFTFTFYLSEMMDHDDVIYNDLPLYHIGGAFNMIVRAVYAGCSVAIWDKFSSKQFWNRILISKATCATLVDVMVHWLLQAEETKSDRRNTLNKVHVQPLMQSHHLVAKRFGFDFITVGYGATETGYACFSLINELDDRNGTPPEFYYGRPREEILKIADNYNIPVQDGHSEIKRGYMGKSSMFVETTILDEHDEVCNIGEVGQIAIRPLLPNTILTEYLGNATETLKAFRNLWFHTGDAGYFNEDGFFYFVDRMGTIIRVKGENISSYQVEDIINKHESVNLSAVFPIPADEGDEDDVVAFIVLHAGKHITENEMHKWIEESMPKYMRPKYIRFINDIPRTPTNKAEKYKLKKKIMDEISTNASS